MPRLTMPSMRVGDVFENNTVVSLPEYCVQSAGNRKRWRVAVRCKCGHTRVVACLHLTQGERTSGCAKCIAGTGPTKHGQASNRIYSVWQNMKNRCLNPRDKKFADYGGRGITLCDAWKASFAAFWEWAQANGYESSLEIDREDNNGNYEPDNCRFVTRRVNLRNMRSNRNLTAFGETKCMADWVCDPRCRVSKSLLAARIRNGWNEVEAISTPAHPMKDWRREQRLLAAGVTSETSPLDRLPRIA